MSKRKTKQNTKLIYLGITVIIIIALILLGAKDTAAQIASNVLGIDVKNLVATSQTITDNTNTSTNTNKLNQNLTENSENLAIYFIDVGQADSILITNNNEAMLIDAGNNDDGDDVVKFIKEKGVTNLKYVIGTHPHEDHIGGLDTVINSDINIEKIWMPKIQANTKTYEDVLDAVSNKKLKIKEPKKGDVLQLGNAEGKVMTDSILNSESLNLSSIVIQLNYGQNKFLFMGDAETENENSIDTWEDVDLLKVGHHGSKTSSSSRFLKMIKPEYSIIMAEKGNSYGLPKDEILKRIESVGSKIYRTDLLGTITVVSDGNSINIK